MRCCSTPSTCIQRNDDAHRSFCVLCGTRPPARTTADSDGRALGRGESLPRSLPSESCDKESALKSTGTASCNTPPLSEIVSVTASITLECPHEQRVVCHFCPPRWERNRLLLRSRSRSPSPITVSRACPCPPCVNAQRDTLASQGRARKFMPHQTSSMTGNWEMYRDREGRHQVAQSARGLMQYKPTD